MVKRTKKSKAKPVGEEQGLPIVLTATGKTNHCAKCSPETCMKFSKCLALAWKRVEAQIDYGATAAMVAEYARLLLMEEHKLLTFLRGPTISQYMRNFQ